MLDVAENGDALQLVAAEFTPLTELEVGNWVGWKGWTGALLSSLASISESESRALRKRRTGGITIVAVGTWELESILLF